MSSYEQAWSTLLTASAFNPDMPCNRISAADIKQLGVEPRLMTKHDARAARPQPLKDRGLFLLPATNSSYHVLREDGYCDLRPQGIHQPCSFAARYPFAFESLAHTESEMSHLDRLYLSGVIQDFVGSDALYATVRGRRFSPAFTYYVGDIGPLTSSGIQYEVDQGYESAAEVILFEAKTTSPPDFLIRQLYFPYRVLSMRCTKRVRCVFMNYRAETGVYSLYEYHFPQLEQYRSIELLRQTHYRIATGPPAQRSLGDFLRDAPPALSLGPWEVPQADDFSKVFELPLRVAEGFNTGDALAVAFDFDRRQSSYYRKACEQMGLVKSTGGRYVLTDLGQRYLTMSGEQRIAYMVGAVVATPIVRASLDAALKRADRLVIASDVESLVLRHAAVRGETARRRAQSVKAWLRWVEQALGGLLVDGSPVKIEGRAL